VVRLWRLKRAHAAPDILYGSLQSGFHVAPARSRKPPRPSTEAVEVDLDTLSEPPGGATQALAFSKDGQTLLVGRQDGSAQLWSFSNREQIPAPRAWQAHGIGRPVRAVAISPNAAWLATGCDDGTIALWDRNDVRAEPRTLGTRGAGVYCLGFSPDGATLFSGNSDGEVASWPVSPATLADAVCGKVHRDLTEAEWKRYVGEGVPQEPVCPHLVRAKGH
jgi:WD40 repeat protein